MLPEIFKVHENDLIEKIRNSESPFLGLFEDYFEKSTRRHLVSFIQQSYDPFREFTESLIYFPALLSTLLAVQLLEDFGEHGHFEIYPVIEKIFGEELTQSKKEKLWKAFRWACVLNMGISVSPRTSGTHYMVEEYLRQAGLPLRYVDKFTEKAIRYANQAGVPDIDDPESLKLWQNGFIEKLNTPFPISARRAIERDDSCYYSQQFIQLFTKSIDDSHSLTRLQNLILKTITDGPQVRTIKRAAIPQIVLRDLEYGVLLPGGERVEWQITVGENTHTYVSQVDERFVPFDADLLTSVSIRNENGAKWEYPLWEDEKNNRLLLFSLPTGKFVKKASLADKEIFVDPGEYMLLMRFSPADDENLEVFSENPSLYLKKIHLNPGQKISVQRGPAELVVEADDIPLLNFIEKPLRGVRGNELYPAQGLKLEILIPKEMLEAGVGFLLRIKSQSLGDGIVVPISKQEISAFVLDVGETITGWKPGVSRLLFELYREDSKRPLVRKSVVVWNGLTYVEKRVIFHCHKMPSNLFQDGCENIKDDLEKQHITFRDETNRFFKMAFDDGNRKLYFTWAVPGVFLSLCTYTGHEEIERGIRLEETISINATTRKVLNIYASEPAIIRLGEFAVSVDFSRVGSKKISLASLVEYMGPSSNTLELITHSSSEPIPLVNLVSPFEVLNYHVETDRGFRKINFTVANEIHAVRVTTQNLLNGEEHYAEFLISGTEEEFQDELVPGVDATLFIAENNACNILFSVSGWPAGFWLLDFKVLANGRWGGLTNSKNQLYADGILVSAESTIRTVDEIYSEFKSNHDPEALPEILSRIHRALLFSYARECWGNIYWLENFWAKISRRLQSQCDNDMFCRMLELSTKRHQDAFKDFRISTYNLGAILPIMFCLEQSCYQKITDGSSSLLGCFSFFPKISELYSLFAESEVDTAALFGFSNAMEVVGQQKKPLGFSFGSYKVALKQRDIQERWRLLNDDQWVPAKGDMLGPMHYRYALSRFQEIVKNNMTIESTRRGKAFYLVRKMSSHTIADFVDSSDFRNFRNELDLGLFDYDQQQPEWVDDEFATEREHQLTIIRFLSLFAQICRCESRSPGVLEKFSSKIREKCEYSHKDLNKTLGYLLSIGEDLFAYYLFLWELVFTADCDQQPRRVYVRS